MSSIAAFLLALCGPLVVRAIIALGFTAITYTGVSAVVSTLVGMAQSNWASLPATVLALASLSGIPQALGIIFGAYAARVAMWVAMGATKYVVKAV